MQNFKKNFYLTSFKKNCFCSRTIKDVSDPSRKIMIQFFVNSSIFFDIFLSQKVKGGKQKFHTISPKIIKVKMDFELIDHARTVQLGP